MPVRRVYLDKTQENFCSNSLANINDFQYNQTYNNYDRYKDSLSRGLFFDDSGTRMYIGMYSSGIIDQYDLSIPWDINSATLNYSLPLSGHHNGHICNILSFIIVNNGSDLYYGDNVSGLLGINYITRGTLASSWDLDTFTYGGASATSFTELYGFSQEYPYQNSLTSLFASPSQSTYSASYLFSPDGAGPSILNAYGTFSHRLNSKVYILTNKDEFFDNEVIIYQYYKNIVNSYSVLPISSGYFTPSISNSGNVGHMESMFVDPYGENLYILSTSGLVHQYISSGLHWYGSSDSGINIQNLFYLPKYDSNSISDYIDEGTTINDKSNFFISVDSGLSTFSLKTEIPFVKNVSDIYFDVGYESIVSGMKISDILVTMSNVKSAYTPVNSGYYLNNSGINNINLNIFNNSVFNSIGNSSGLTIMFDLFSPASGNKITSLNLSILGDYYPATGINDFPLYINAEPTNRSLDLFLGNYHLESDIDLFIHGYTNISGTIPLFTEGSIELNDNIPLYISGNPVNNNIPLYIPGAFSAEHVDLYIYGHDTENSGLSLSIHGHELISGDFPLYIQGVVTQTDSLNLYLDAGELTPDSSNFPLFMWATNNSGLYSTFPLSIGSDTSPDPTHNLNLFLGNNSTADLYGSMPLYLYNDNSSIKDLDLFIANYYTNISGSIPLYLFTENYGSGRAELPLFIARDSESLAGVVPLFLSTTETINEDIDLFIEGSNSGINDSVNLYISGIDPIDLTMKLFTKGI